MKITTLKRHALLSAAVTAGFASIAHAAPYASGVVQAGTNVSFILNEAADLVVVSFPNGGAPITIDGSSKGLKSFSVPAAGTPFTIYTSKSDTVGYTIPLGTTTASSTNGLSQASNNSGYRRISDDTSVLNRFNSPRGVSVNNTPSSPTFGTTYVANSAAGTAAAITGVVAARTLGDGLYALNADGSDAFGYGNTARSGIAAWTATPSSSAPWRLHAAADGNVYIADFSDATGNVWRMDSSLSNPRQMLNGIGGPSAVPAGQNHGSTTSVYVEGSDANGNLTLYTVDEDLTTGNVGGPTSSEKNNLWRYNIGTSDAANPFAGNPSKINTTAVLLNAASSDLDRGRDGKFYLAQNRSGGAEPGIVVLDANGVKLYDSLTASKDILGPSTTVDILRNVQGMAVSPDQQWMALMLNNSDVAVVPLVDGIPDIANRLIVDTGTDVISGRDIAFDAAGNIYYVSSGQGYLRTLSPGGTQQSLLSFDGSSFAFTTAIPEPTGLAAVAGAALGLLARRRRTA